MNKIDSNYILNDSEILEMYERIDKVNEVPFSHGLKHIKNTIKLADKLAKVFSFDNREREILKVCEALHDIGQVDGRDNHGFKSAIFAKKYLSKFNYYTNEEIEMICSAISTHSEKKDFNKLENTYSWFLLFIDKMDFSFKRLENNSLEKFGYLIYNDIKDLHFELENNIFKIYIELIDNPKIVNSDNIFDDPGFMQKLPKIIKEFANHYNLIYQVYLDNKKVDIDRHSK